MNDTFRIERTREDHISQIYEIEKATFTVPWSKNALYQDIVENMLSYYVTAFYKDNIVGYGGMWIVDDEAHITNVAVHKDYRGYGIGNAILSALILKCKISNIRYMSLEVRVSNVTAQKLYLKHGFEIEGLRKRYYSDNHEDAYVMWKCL